MALVFVAGGRLSARPGRAPAGSRAWPARSPAASWVHASEGNETAADTACDDVLTRTRDWQYGANVHLHEALCTVANGGTDQGARQAATVLDALPAAYRTNMITYTGDMVLGRVPIDQRHRPAVRELHEVLTRTTPQPALPPAT